MAPPTRHPSRRTPSSQSPSPDPELVRYLSEQKRPQSPDSEAFRKQRIAAAGVFNVKSRHQKEKEEVERRRVEEEHDAAKAYKDFVQDMQGEDGRGYERKNGGFVRAGGSSSYAPAVKQPISSVPLAPRAMQGSENYIERSTKNLLDDDEGEEDAGNVATSQKREPPGKRKRAMDDFLGELQRDQAIREERLKYQVSEGNSISKLLAQEAGGGSKPWNSSDAASTNVCILNLPANVNERSMGEYFSWYGDVASVKIMWSRGADTEPPALRVTKTPGSTGFINFMNRVDAERAYQQIEDSFWLGSRLKVGWGKALRKPPLPLFYKSDASKYRNENVELSIGGVGSVDDRHARSSRSPGSRNHRRARERSKSPVSTLRDAILKESGEEVEKRIVGVAMPVREYGKGYEDMVAVREEANPYYNFLRRKGSIAHQYYRALLGEVFMPDLPPVAFQDDGEASLYSSDSEEDSEWERLKADGANKVLGKAAKRRLEAMLRGITLRRERIARIMLFAIEHASAAETITDIVISSLLQPATPLSRKLARLYVVSDILHNSSVSASNAWRYRSLFESKLDKVFLHWGDIANSFNGRIKRESCKEMIRNVLNVWENWLIYENSKLISWRDYAELGGTATTNTKKNAEDEASDVVAGKAMHDDSLRGRATETATTSIDDIDGEEM